MPVQIQCTSVVIRNDALDRVLEGGASAFRAIAPNGMSYGDDCLSQASFMSPLDAEEFAKSLELRGLNRNTEAPDFVVVQSHDQSVNPPCDWLLLFEYERRLIATMRGNESTTVIASKLDATYDPDSIKHYSIEEIEQQFEFVERKDNIDTYRHKDTGELVYHTRQTETLDEIFSRVFRVVWKYRREPGRPERTGDAASAIKEQIPSLQSLVAKYPDVAKVSLALGMAWFALGKSDVARRHLEHAVQLEPENTILLKELGAVCLDQSDFAAATKTATQAVAISPDDPELLGNLAVIQLLSGEGTKAKKTISHALSIDPNDAINVNVRTMIDDVLQGRRRQPKSLVDLMKSKRSKLSFIAKIFGFRK